MRIGLIIPSSNRMVEDQMVRYVPEQVGAHVTRLRMTGAQRMPLAELLPKVREAAASLADAHCDVVAFHCTANSMENGLDGEQKILEAVREGGAKHATTTATACRNAFEALRVKRLLLITPYDAQTTEHEAVYLRAAGYEVVQQVARDLRGSDGYCAATPDSWIATVREVKRDDVDTYFLSCANINVMGIIDDLERELNRPVITSNQVVIWDALRAAGSSVQPDRLGRIFNLAAV